jgi:ribonuclease P protein component
MRGAPRAASDWPSEPALSAPAVKAAGAGRVVPIGRSADFERVLRTKPRAISAHFALHHLATVATLAPTGQRSPTGELSTDRGPVLVHPVDDSLSGAPAPAASAPRTYCSSDVAVGLVVPKRHARRAVTRTLLKREMRAAVQAPADRFPAGLWVVRLRAPFDRAAYPSAASVALRRAARCELESLMRDGAAAPSRSGRSR